MISRSSTRWIKGLAATAAVLALGACTAMEGASDNPVLRKFQWFSYMEGGDFKEACGAGAPDRYRMVYNAVYTEQVRVYELDPAAGMLQARVILPANLVNVEVREIGDLLDPWRGQSASIALADSDVEGLVRDLEGFGAFGPPNVGAELSSKGFFWTIAACHKGQYHFTGFQWPDPSWNRATFASRLFVLDTTGVAVNDPRWTPVMRTHPTKRDNEGQTANEFHIKVGEHGLAGFEPLL